MTLETPNTHAVRDPVWGQAVVEKLFREQLGALSDLVQYGADLLMRAMIAAGTSRSQGLVLTVLFRQALVSADAAEVLLRQGAVDAAHLQLRALMEARWGLILAIRDPEKWGKQIYVTSLHEIASWARQAVPGTEAHKANEEIRALVVKYGGEQVGEEEGRVVVDAIVDVLQRDEHRELSNAFAAYEARQHRPPPWYYDPSADKPLSSIWALTKEIGTTGEYKSIYRHASYFVHGGYSGTHMKHDALGGVVSPIRTPEGASQGILLTFSLLADCIRRVIDKWREGELAQYTKQYAEIWKPIIDRMRDVDVQIERAVNRT